MQHEHEDNNVADNEIVNLTFEGRTALAAGEPTRALELLSRKHEMIVQQHGEDSLYAAASGIDLAEALAACGRHEEAGRLFDRGLRRRSELLVDDVFRAVSGVAMSAYFKADYPSAEARFNELIPEMKRRGDKYDLKRAYEQDHLGQVLLRVGRYSEAEALFLEDLSIFEREVPGEGPTAVCLGYLGKLYFATNRFREAEVYGRRALEMCEQVYGAHSMHVATALDNLAMTVVMLAQSDKRKDLAAQAVSLGERAVRIFDATLPPSHPSVSWARRNLSGYRQTYSVMRDDSN